MAQESKKSCSLHEAIPIVEDTSVFESRSERFAMGVFSPESVVNYETDKNELLKGYLKLRANVYIDQADILSDDARRHDGTELDSDDERSIHFVTFEKRMGAVAVIASMRLIVKGDNSIPLPLEEIFPTAFDEPIPPKGVEVSRFISRHSEDSTHKDIKAKTIMAALAYVSANNFGPVVGEIERKLKKSLRMFGVQSEEIGEPAFVEEGGKNGEPKHITELIAVRIPTDSLEARFGKEAVKNMTLKTGEFMYWGELKSQTEEKSDGEL